MVARWFLEATRFDPFHKEKENVRSSILHYSNVVEKPHCPKEFKTHFLPFRLSLKMQVRVFQGKLFTELSYNPMRT